MDNDEPSYAAIATHMAAINTRQRARFAASVDFPFVHIEPDGQRLICNRAEELPDPASVPFHRAEIAAAKISARTPALVVWWLRFQRYDADDQATEQADALWGAAQVEGGWIVVWRQYLGVVGATTAISLFDTPA